MIGPCILSSKLRWEASQPHDMSVDRGGRGPRAGCGSAMKARYWLLGSTLDVAATGRRLAEVLMIDLRMHSSDDRGGDYMRGSGSGVEEVIVQENFRDDEGYLVEEDYPDFPTLIYITQPQNGGPPLDTASTDTEVLRVEDL